MPRGDGTGPMGLGPMGPGSGNRTGRGMGRMGGTFSAGVDGYCVCPNCGTKVKHERAVPCAGIKCPNCGTMMTRES